MENIAIFLMQIGKFIAVAPIVTFAAGMILATIFGCNLTADSYHACMVGGIDFGFLGNFVLLALNIPLFLIAGLMLGIVGFLLSKLAAYLNSPTYTVK